MRALYLFLSLFSLLLHSGHDALAARSNNPLVTSTSFVHENNGFSLNNPDRGFTLVEDTDFGSTDDSAFGESQKPLIPLANGFVPAHYVPIAVRSFSVNRKPSVALTSFHGTTPIYIAHRVLRI